VALGVGVEDGFGVEVTVGSGVSEGVDPSCELFGVGEGSAGSSESLGLAGVSELSGEDGTTGAARVGVGVGSTTLFESGFDSVSPPPPQLTTAIEIVARARIRTMSIVDSEYV
jgi:hypothetical protein